ncbi:MAG TPA: HypC/HybG/HupF family hydrogenase formation chaperone [Nocardioides sp.]|uniref:HypC/HybG/HupF family hydrogenase formation chaperone n=1 Tax=Nocardioides sp. TaxID=35761 RepID=UPI002CECDB63|nr:HypC/HybG/HupF family hydrogenase formation chaperone [Nocardioides sp.]HQR27030.1 HypC/HybG/HupF family hydrogenase formation chaperone [Nocardioides sp.]
MCLGIPGRLVGTVDADNHLATVDVNGVRRTISVRLLADTGLAEGDWVLVHVGFALAQIDEEEARLTLDQLERMGRDYADELAQFGTTDVR